MKTNVYIPIDRIEDHFSSVLLHVQQYFEGSQIILWNSTGDKRVTEWIETQTEAFDFTLIKTKASLNRSPLIALRLAIEISKKDMKGLLFLNPHVLVNSQIAPEILSTLKSIKRIGIIGVPTEGLDHKLSTFFKYSKFSQAGLATPATRRVPLICTYLSGDFIEKMNLKNLYKSKVPPSLYLSTLCTKLGFQKVLLNKARANQAKLTVSKKTVKNVFRFFLFWRIKVYIRESALDRYNFEIPPAKSFSRL